MNTQPTEQKFRAWMQKVNHEVELLCGMSSDDLPDVCYRDWFDDGVTPSRAAKRAMKNAMDLT
jgi:hypothetical protein